MGWNHQLVTVFRFDVEDYYTTQLKHTDIKKKPWNQDPYSPGLGYLAGDAATFCQKMQPASHPPNLLLGVLILLQTCRLRAGKNGLKTPINNTVQKCQQVPTTSQAVVANANAKIRVLVGGCLQ